MKHMQVLNNTNLGASGNKVLRLNVLKTASVVLAPDSDQMCVCESVFLTALLCECNVAALCINTTFSILMLGFNVLDCVSSYKQNREQTSVWEASN